MSKQFTAEEIEQAAASIYPLTDIPDRANPNYDFCINFNSLQEDRRIEWAKGAKWGLEAYKQQGTPKSTTAPTIEGLLEKYNRLAAIHYNKDKVDCYKLIVKDLEHFQEYGNRADYKELWRQLQEIWQLVNPRDGKCRDCADTDVMGICDNDGLPCDPHERAVVNIKKLLSKQQGTNEASTQQETLEYIKDLMVLNNLNTLEELDAFRQDKKQKMKGFINELVSSPEYSCKPNVCMKRTVGNCDLGKCFLDEQIPTQSENPKGLHLRYLIKKLVPKTEEEMKKEIAEKEKGCAGRKPQIRPFFGYKVNTHKEVDIDDGAEYFVMRLDEGGSDLKHISACRVGIHAYADAIESHLPELAKDLRERYPLLSSQAPTQQPANAVEFAEWLLYTPDIFQLTGQFEIKDFKYKGEKYTTAEMYDLFSIHHPKHQ